MKSSRFASCVAGLLFLLVLTSLAGPGWSRGAEAKPAKVKHYESTDAIFTNAEVLRIEIEIPEQGIETLRGYRFEGFRGEESPSRPSAKATVRDGQREYKDVAVHLKGAAGSFRSIDDEPSLTLNFDKHVKGQTFRGLERFSLNNSVQDPSLLNEQVTRELFLAAGVPAPRATHVRVSLNGRDLGIYVLTEAFNKQFLALHFKNPNGNLYDGGFLRDITDPLEKSSGPKAQDRSDLARLAEACREPNLTNRLARLRQVLDFDRFIAYLAVDMMSCNWDGYALNRNNYRIYHDPGSDQIVFMPHGLDQMFGVMRSGPDMTLFPRRWSGLVARAVMQTPEGRRLYREKVRELTEKLFDPQTLTNRVQQLAAELRPVLAQIGPRELRSQEHATAEFCGRIVERCRSIREQLDAPERTLQFSGAGAVPLTGWQSRVESGKPLLEETSEGTKKLLHISASGSSVGVWTTRVQLEPGQYRLEGRARSKGVVPDPGDRKGGAGIRTSTARLNQKLLGDAGWTELAFEFDLQDSAGGDFPFMAPIEEENRGVEIRCELRAAKGEVWFDLESLRIRRVP